MSLTRFDLPPTEDGREQFAMLERRPDRDQMADIERRVRQASRNDSETEAQNGLMAVLVDSWTVYDRKGETVPPPSQSIKALGRVHADLLVPLIKECRAIVEGVDRGGAIEQVSATIRQLALILDDEKHARVEAIVAELTELFGVPDPNA